MTGISHLPKWAYDEFPALRKAHWALIAVETKAYRDYIENTRHLFREEVPMRKAINLGDISAHLAPGQAEKINAIVDAARAKHKRAFSEGRPT